MYGAKRMLRIATEDGKDAYNVKGYAAPSQTTHFANSFMSKILQMPNLYDTDFLACALWPNNPSLHPPILIGLFEHWDGKTPFDPASLPVLIYKDLRTESARYLVELDQELVSLVKALAKHHPNNPNLQLNYSLKVCLVDRFKAHS